MTSSLERKFVLYWRELKGPAIESEFRFHPERKWRFDFAIPSSKIAIEIEGGMWTGGRHTRGSGYARDCEKYNTAAAMGWRIFRLGTGMINTSCVQQIIDATKQTEAKP